MVTGNEKKRRVLEHVIRTMSDAGMTEAGLVAASGLDPQTVRTFLRGDTYPQAKKRAAIEKALGLNPGALELVGNGLVDPDKDTSGDPVERAISRSALTRANQHTLIGTYYGMLDQQRERGA